MRMNNLSFRAKTSIVASLVVGAVTIVGFILFILFSYQELAEEIKLRARLTADMQATTISQSLWDIDKNAVNKALQALQNDPDFTGAVIYDEEGEIFAWTGERDEKKLESAETASADITYLFGEEVKNIGRLEVKLTNERLWQKMRTKAVYGLALFTAIITLLVISIFITLRILTRPLGNITTAMIEYGQGKKDIHVPMIKAQDEIGDLARTFGKMKHELDILQHNLEEKVVERTVQLQAAKEEADRANNAKSEFVANISHELRAPLNAIIGFSDLIVSESFGPINNEKYADYCVNINKSGGHLLQIINDILDISKAEAAELKLEKIEFNLREDLQDIRQMFALQTERKGIYLNLDLDESIPEKVVGDMIRTKQIFINLIGNAIKFTEKGGITIKAKYTPSSKRLNVEVIDTGIGISKDKVEEVFAKFSQAEESTNRKYGGTGLGLAITRTLIEMMGGAIKATSKLGVGTSFKFHIKFD